MLGIGLEPVRASCSVVPGSSAADLMMRLMMMTPLEKVKQVCPAGAFAIVVDDLQILIHAPPGEVAAKAKTVCDVVFAALQGEAGLPISLPKLQVTGSSAGLRHDMARRSRFLRRAAVRSTRNLGVDYASGCVANQAVRKKRIIEAMKKAKRCRLLKVGPDISSWLVKSSIGPGALFGVALTGITPALLQRVRGAMHTAITPKPKGRSATWDLATAGTSPKNKVDPTTMCLALPIAWLAAGHHAKLLGPGMIRQCHEVALEKMKDHPRPWSLVAGPIGAAVSSALQLSWTHKKDLQWITVEGTTVDLAHDSPYDIKKLAIRDAEHLLWAKAGATQIQFSHLTAPPLLRPFMQIRSELTSHSSTRRKWHGLSAYLSGSLIGHSKCLCGFVGDRLGVGAAVGVSSSSVGQGFWSHWFWDCPITYNIRREFCFKDGFLTATQGYLTNPWFVFAMVPDPCCCHPFSTDYLVETAVWYFSHDGMDALFAGPVFGDGSAIHNQNERLLRAGWGAIELNSLSCPALEYRSAKGTLPQILQSVPAAELFAMFFWLQHLDPCYTDHVYYSDCAWVVGGWHGEFNPLDVWTPHLDLWKRVLRLRSDLPSSVRVLKTKAHQTHKQAEGSPRLQWEKVGNDIVDGRAKQAAALAEHPQDLLDRLHKAETLVLMLGRYFARAVHLALKHQLLVAREEVPRVFRIRACTRHLVARWPGGAMRCLRCFRLQNDCIGQQASVCSVSGRRHLPSIVPGGVFCGRCGAYSFGRTMLLTGTCKGKPANIGASDRLVRLSKGLHPMTGKDLGGRPQALDIAQGMFEVMLGPPGP